MDKLKLHRKSVYVSHVDQLIFDSFLAMLAARDSIDETNGRREARSSILHAALAIEHLANNCVKAIDLSKRLFDAVEQMGTVDKLEFFFREKRNGEKFDRGSKIIQTVSELISLRNSYVHSKVHEMKEGQWQTLGISKASNKWAGDEAERVFRALMVFLEQFTVKLCQLSAVEISWMLRSFMTTNEQISFLLIQTTDRETLRKLADFLKSDLAFMGVDINSLREKGLGKSFTIDLSEEQIRQIKELQESSEKSCSETK